MALDDSVRLTIPAKDVNSTHLTPEAANDGHQWEGPWTEKIALDGIGSWTSDRPFISRLIRIDFVIQSRGKGPGDIQLKVRLPSFQGLLSGRGI
jgi:hypothetical protein